MGIAFTGVILDNDNIQRHFQEISDTHTLEDRLPSMLVCLADYLEDKHGEQPLLVQTIWDDLKSFRADPPYRFYDDYFAEKEIDHRNLKYGTMTIPGRHDTKATIEVFLQAKEQEIPSYEPTEVQGCPTKCIKCGEATSDGILMNMIQLILADLSVLRV